VNIPAGLLTPAWQVAAWIAWVATLALLRHPRDWRVLSTPSRLNLWLATVAVVLTLWSIRMSLPSGFGLHLLGATVVSLMFGPRLAQVALYLVVALVTLLGMAGADAYAANALLTAALPVWVSHGILRAAERWLPAHIFVYIFVAGFFAGGAALAVSGAAVAALHVALGGYDARLILEDFLPYALLLAWGEAFLSGMLTAMMVVYYPGWVSSFDDARYLRGR
jgi:uncharacterized membrane protein